VHADDGGEGTSPARPVEARQQGLPVDALVFDVLGRDVIGRHVCCCAHEGLPYCDPATPAFSTMAPQRWISDARKRLSSGSGGLWTGMVPRSIICLWMSGKRPAASSSACSCSMIGCGVPAGATISSHPTESKPFRPASDSVGIFGAAGTRV